MADTLLRGFWRHMVPIPPMLWRRQVSARAKRIAAGLGFMSEEHHRVRNFVVRELPVAGEPLSPEFISEKLSLPVDRVRAILDELERRMTFLYRNGLGEVVWAYPVTVEPTPHRLTFSSGEQLYSA
jgi:hypothetical protein